MRVPAILCSAVSIILLQVDWANVRKMIEDIAEDETTYNPSADGASNGGGGHPGPMFLRLAWHCSGTWCKGAKNGGSDGGTMRFAPECDHGGNAGLHIARGLLEPVKEAFPAATYADIYVLAGVVSIEAMGGPKVAFRPGRTDAPGPATPQEDNRFSPDIQHVRDVFHRMGFNDREIVALCGAHAVGRCHTDRSGFWGPWTRAESTFSNEYFRELVENKWTLKKTHKGKKWTGPEQYEDPTGDLMMLPADMALVWDEKFKKHVEVYAKDEALWFKDFSAAYQKLNELGVTQLNGTGWRKYILFGARSDEAKAV